MNLPKIPKALIDDLVSGRCVVFVGAGLSQGVGLPGWSQLLERMIDWSNENNIDVKDKSELKDLIQKKKLLLVAEDLKERMGKERLRRFLKEVFSEWTEPSNTQQLLAQLPFSAAITTNYDRLLEMAYAKQRQLPDVFTQ